MATSNTRFTQNSLGQSKNPIDSDHGIYRDLRNVVGNYPFERSQICGSDRWQAISGRRGHACKPVAVF